MTLAAVICESAKLTLGPEYNNNRNLPDVGVAYAGAQGLGAKVNGKQK